MDHLPTKLGHGWSPTPSIFWFELGTSSKQNWNFDELLWWLRLGCWVLPAKFLRRKFLSFPHCGKKMPSYNCLTWRPLHLINARIWNTFSMSLSKKWKIRREETFWHISQKLTELQQGQAMPGDQLTALWSSSLLWTWLNSSIPVSFQTVTWENPVPNHLLQKSDEVMKSRLTGVQRVF